MFDDQNAGFRVAACVAAVLGAAAIYVLRSQPLPAVAVAATPSASVPPAAAAANPVVVPTPDAALSESATTRDNTIASVFQCDKGGQRIYSDQRCGEHAHVRQIEAPSRMDRQDTSILSQHIAYDVSDRQPIDDAASDLRAQCVELDQEIRAIDARARQGHSAAEGELLKDRRASLRDRVWQLRCPQVR
jgi:hypothetical protein